MRVCDLLAADPPRNKSTRSTGMVGRTSSCKSARLLLSSLAVFTALTGHVDAQQTLKATKDTVHWGYFSKKLSPKLTIQSGATVVEVEMLSVSDFCAAVFAPESAFCIKRGLTAEELSQISIAPIHINSSFLFLVLCKTASDAWFRLYDTLALS